MRRRRIVFVGLVVYMEDTKLFKCVMFGELVEGVGCVGEREKSGWGHHHLKLGLTTLCV